MVAVIALINSVYAPAQFKDQAFSQQYNDGSGPQTDTVDRLFSVKDFRDGLTHRSTMKLQTAFIGSTVIAGGMQIYNRQYWKLPLVYGAIAGGVGAGIYFGHQGNSTASTLCYAGAGLAYWGALMDGVVNYKPHDYPDASRATLYSLLLPGLGQIYNREYWKIPIYLGAMAYGINYYSDCQRNFIRFRDIYREASDAQSGYDGPVSAEQALYYRNIYRRYRDYSILAVAVLYLVQAIDANVFTYMHNFEVSDDLSMSISPALIAPGNTLALSPGTAVGVRLGLRF